MTPIISMKKFLAKSKRMLYYILSDNEQRVHDGLIEKHDNPDLIKSYLINLLENMGWKGIFRVSFFRDVTDYLPFETIELRV